MKTKISNKNPFRCDRYAFAFENLQEGKRYLDYGCFDGKFIYETKKNKDIEYIGVDKNKDIIKKNPYNQKLIHFEKFPLPFKNSYFDGVTILDVLEHIYRQDEVLKEINRILKKNGELIITVPKKHIFSFLDIGNYKFIFPTIHMFFYIFFKSKKEYYYKYVNNPYGLIGDIEKEKAWHQHFSNKEMKNLLNKYGFEIETFDGSGLFTRVFVMLDLFKIGKLIPKKLRYLDCLYFDSMNLFCKAIKIKEI